MTFRLVSGLGCQAEDWIGLNQAVAVVQRQTNCTLYDQVSCSIAEIYL